MAPQAVGYAPNLEKFLKSLKKQPLEASIESLVALLRRRQIKGPEPCAVATAQILLQVVARARWNDVDQLLAKIQQVGRRLVDAQPRELVIGNITRRILGLVRDEAEEDRNGNEMSESVSDIQNTPTPIVEPSRPRLIRQPTLSASSSTLGAQFMFNLLSADPVAGLSVAGSGASTPISRGQSANAQALRSEVMDGIEEIKDEISQADDQIAGFAEAQIHPTDYVLVYRPSPTVERFLVKAASKRRFTVLLAGEPTRKSNEAPHASLRKKLAAAKVKTIKISASGVAAYIPKVTKVILDARAILADGGVVADGGAGLVARAAHYGGKAVIVLGGVWKVSPEAWDDPSGLVEWGDPSGLANYADGALIDGVDVEAAATEYVEPGLVSLYISNLGPHSRDHLQNVVADHYKKEDVDFYTQ